MIGLAWGAPPSSCGTTRPPSPSRSRGVGLAGRAGAPTRLATACCAKLAGLHLHTGDFAAAARLVDEARTISIATGPQAHVPRLLRDARRVARTRPRWLGVSEPARAGTPIGSAAAAVLHNGLARDDDVLAAARRVWEGDDEVVPSAVLLELIEAAARAGEPELAAAALEHLEARTQLAGTEWALGIEARPSWAIISDGDAAEKHYRDAIHRLGRCGAAADEARGHLLHGECLRRQRRRVDARRGAPHRGGDVRRHGGPCLRGAGRTRAARDRRARPSWSVGRADDLTPREIQVAELARAGESNPQIGARLFISARTVEYHLRKVFAKLGIESRRQLAVRGPARLDRRVCAGSRLAGEGSLQLIRGRPIGAAVDRDGELGGLHEVLRGPRGSGGAPFESGCPALPEVSSTVDSRWRVEMWSLANTLCRWYSTVRRLIVNCAAISGFERP